MPKNKSRKSHPPKGEERRSDDQAAVATQQVVPIEEYNQMAEMLKILKARLAVLTVEKQDSDKTVAQLDQHVTNYAAVAEKLKAQYREKVKKLVEVERELKRQQELNKALEERAVSCEKKSEERDSVEEKMRPELENVKVKQEMPKAGSVEHQNCKPVNRKLYDVKSCHTSCANDVVALHKKIASLTAELENYDAAQSKMHQENDSLKNELTKLKSERDQTKVKGIQTNLSRPTRGKASQTISVGTDPETSKKERAAKIEESVDLKEASTNSEEKLRKVVTELAMKDDAIAVNEKVISGQEKGFNALKVKLSEKTKLVRRQEKELSEMKKALAVKEEMIEGQANEIASIKNQLRSLDGLLATVGNELIRKDEIIIKNSDELNILKTKLTDMEQLMKEKNNENAINVELRHSKETVTQALLTEPKNFKGALLSEQNESVSLKQTSEAFMSALLVKQNNNIHNQATLRGLDQLLATTEKVLISKEDLIRNQGETITKLEKQIESFMEEKQKAKTDFRKTTHFLATQVNKLKNERDLMKDSYELSLTDKMQYAHYYESKISKLNSFIDETERNARKRESQFRFRINSITQVVQDCINKTDKKMEGCKSPVRYHYLKKRNLFCEKLHDSIFSLDQMC